MPEESALGAALAGGPDHRGWTVQSYLLAQLINAVRVMDTNNVRVAGGKIPPPQPVEVPALRKKRPRLDLSNHPHAQQIERG
ncbi:hypothetical protein [Streptacidiphilus sp. P02-A3a]|uniref:hypothetical protein n=1 Tax=Streptacidiphilus sp. P02-A3a TaxID=2704468 RepID=UPI0015F79FC7|nr:hypothetical protein [Streptacidiphilus sp. P02-A3a]QMU72137.1 hypothetical protein GXP74_31760 [Streptacidiphilus sp. P02-A3a]